MCLSFWAAVPLVDLTANMPDGAVVIRLHGVAAEVSNSTIFVRDVASISGGTAALRDRIGNLDLDTFESGQSSRTIIADQIRYRLMLNGISEKQFSIVGPPQAIANLKARVNPQQRWEQSLARQLAIQFGMRQTDLEVSINQTSVGALSKLDIDLATSQISARFGSDLPVGSRTVEAWLSDETGKSARARIAVSVAVMRDLVVVNRNISRGEVIDQESLTPVRRPVADRNVKFASFEQVVGNAAKEDIQQYSVVRAKHVQAPKRVGSNFDIRRNKLVNAVLRRGQLRIQLKNARTVTDGIMGGTIEIINPISGKRMLATVIDSNTVEIQ